MLKCSEGLRKTIQFNIEVQLIKEGERDGNTYDFQTIKWKLFKSYGLFGDEHKSFDDPGKDICTDKADFIEIADSDYPYLGRHPAPTDIEVYCATHPEKFECLGVYKPPKRG